MASPSAQHVTGLLQAWSSGDESALDKLTPLIYGELRRLARGYIGRERKDHTLQTTALVNEAYLKLIDQRNVSWQNRAHFLAVSAKLMRRILVDYARSRRYAKREGETRKVALEEAAMVSKERGADLIAVDDALITLEVVDPRKCQVVELRFFGGLTIEETAEVMQASHATIERDWTSARAWLYREISRGNQDEA